MWPVTTSGVSSKLKCATYLNFFAERECETSSPLRMLFGGCFGREPLSVFRENEVYCRQLGPGQRKHCLSFSLTDGSRGMSAHSLLILFYSFLSAGFIISSF